MDLPLSFRVLSDAPSPNLGGGVVSFSGGSAAELARAGQQALDAYGDPALVPLINGTPATCVRGMSLAASSSGTQYVCELQIEPDEAALVAYDGSPLDQQTPVNATLGTEVVGWTALQFLESTDPAETIRRQNWATQFLAEQQAAKGQPTAAGYIYEVAYAGPFNRGYVMAILWAFYIPQA